MQHDNPILLPCCCFLVIIVFATIQPCLDADYYVSDLVEWAAHRICMQEPTKLRHLAGGDEDVKIMRKSMLSDFFDMPSAVQALRTLR